MVLTGSMTFLKLIRCLMEGVGWISVTLFSLLVALIAAQKVCLWAKGITDRPIDWRRL